MTYHCYYGPEEMETFISFMQQFGRPVVCQEYMGRPRSTFEEIMPILKRERVGAISWGLTAGKCNFHLQWSSKAGDPEPEVWFHDIFRLDGTGAVVWQLLSEPLSRDEALSLLVETFPGVPKARIRHELKQLFQALFEARLIEKASNGP